MENHPPFQSITPASDQHVPHTSESFGTIPQPSEDFRPVPHDSETFGNLPHSSEPFRSVPNAPESFRNERKQTHSITVRDAARMFEDAGVARTERSIVNWCRRDTRGLARLDAYYDPNERRYYLTEESITRTISEEKAKAFRNVPNATEILPKFSEVAKEGNGKSSLNGASQTDASALSKELLDLRILNAGKDMVIKQLREERDQWIQQLIDGSKKVGELETRLLQLGDASQRNRIQQSSSENNPERFGI